MRVLTGVFDLGKGGTQRAAQNFAEAYDELGHDSRVWATNGAGIRQRQLERRGVPVWVGIAPKALQEIARWRPEVIHLHSLGLPPAAVERVIDECPGAKVIETNVFSIPSPWESRLDASFQLSEWCAWLYSRRGGDTRINEVLPYSVIADRFRRAAPEAIAAFRSTHRIPASHLLLGRIGQSSENKWSALTVDAFEHARRSGVAASLLVVNPPEGIIRRCRSSPFRDDIVHIEQITDDADLSVAYSSIDIFVHIADLGESFGMVLAESMLCETPVITLNTPWADNAQAEVVGHSVGGLVANTRRGFLEAMVRLASDPDLRRALGKSGRERIRTVYDPLVLARKALATSRRHERPPVAPVPRGRLVEYSRASIDPPGWVFGALIGRMMALQPHRYLSAHQTWGSLVDRAGRYAARRFRQVVAGPKSSSKNP
jgi:glycosyltransferase involved in cell wall biosynthesis